MKVDDRILNIIEDHESVTQTIIQIVSALQENKPMPNYIPLLHDTLVTDQLSIICEKLNALRK